MTLRSIVVTVAWYAAACLAMGLTVWPVTRWLAVGG